MVGFLVWRVKAPRAFLPRLLSFALLLAALFGLYSHTQGPVRRHPAVEGKDASKIPVILMSPAGRRFNQQIARDLACYDEVIFLCGHYEGIDRRVVDEIVTDEISIGDYVLTGGELPALVIMDAVSRMVPGVLGNDESAQEESFSGMWLEYPQYTRPRVFHDKETPEVLLSGNHEAIRKWRLREAIRLTMERRPDLIDEERMTKEEKKIYQELLSK